MTVVAGLERDVMPTVIEDGSSALITIRRSKHEQQISPLLKTSRNAY